jgi:hypothetical protein
MRPNTLATLAVTTLGVLALGLAQAQSFAPTASLRPTWPPHPKHVVNVYDVDGVQVPPLGTHVVYEVPPDRHLVVTGAWTSGPSFPDLHLGEETDGELIRKGRPSNTRSEPALRGPSGCGGPVGWTFRPGSRVVLENRSDEFHGNTQEYGIVGYLTPR